MGFEGIALSFLAGVTVGVAGVLGCNKLRTGRFIPERRRSVLTDRSESERSREDRNLRNDGPLVNVGGLLNAGVYDAHRPLVLSLTDVPSYVDIDREKGTLIIIDDPLDDAEIRKLPSRGEIFAFLEKKTQNGGNLSAPLEARSRGNGETQDLVTEAMVYMMLSPGSELPQADLYLGGND